MRKKKILYVITRSDGGGAQRYVFDLATNLPKDSFDVSVAVGGNGPFIPRLRAAGIRTIGVTSFVRAVSLFRDLDTLRELCTLFRTEAPDVLHLNSAKAVSIGALAGRIVGVPRIISTIHGSAANETWRPWWQRILIRIVERISRMLAHETIVVSQVDHKPGTILIHNGVGAIDFKSRTEARNALDLDLGALVVGTIGELTHNKNQHALLDAIGALAPSSVTVAIIGNGEMREDLENAARAYPSHDIRFLGFKANAAQYLLAFDIFVLPSLKEGLPYALLEAGQAGLPVIATHVGGIPDIIEDQKNGLLVQAESVLPLTAALRLLRESDSLRAHYGSALNEKVEREFSLEKMLGATTSLY